MLDHDFVFWKNLHLSLILGINIRLIALIILLISSLIANEKVKLQIKRLQTVL